MNDIKYLRNQKENRKLEFKQTLANGERQKRRISFDSVINYELEYKDNIFVLLDKHIEQKLDTKPSLSIYEKFKLIKKERDKYFLTNLGVLFSIHKNDYFPLVKIECARFKGENTKKRNIRLGATIGEIYRQDRWEYPLLALREVIINAVVHRDYSILGSDIKVAIFDDMIEITNPGVFMIDKEKLGLGYSELQCKPAIHQLLNISYFWKWGFSPAIVRLKSHFL